MSNFAFLPDIFASIFESAKKAESYVYSDPRSACFHSRFTLESIVHWLYRHDRSLRMPYDNSLGSLLHESSFQNIVPEKVFQKARLIQKMGNQAVHSQKTVDERDALQLVKELHHICYWLTRTYVPEAPREGAGWRDERIHRPETANPTMNRRELELLTKKLIEQNKKVLKQQQEHDALDIELQQLKEELERIRTERETVPDDHDYSEAETRAYIIDVDLRRAGWTLLGERDREYEVQGMPNNVGLGYVDYVLWGDDGRPLALVEAKKTTIDPDVGQQQAKLYADCLDKMHGQRPLIFYTNGYETRFWDDIFYPPRKVSGFYKKDELQRIILRRDRMDSANLDVAEINETIVERPYQKRAISSIFNHFASRRRKALLVMATGTGKTRTAIALIDVLQRAGWVKRALFLADRVSLVNQAVNAFKAYLPDSSPVNLVTEKNAQGRVYVCTYPTMMGLIDQTDGEESKYGVGYFDIIIIDEAHRSVYQKYGAIFKYFDALLVGLTATPREDIDKNTYDLFELEQGVPTDAYELETAVDQGYLVPPKVEQVDLKFPREGIDYDSLSDEEKEQWESIDWGDDVDDQGMPKQINAAAINSWLFNKNTVDLVLKYVMEYGHKVEAGDRLAKTIIFARNHKHAQFIEERFNHHYPHYAGHFARVIDNYAKYPQSLIDDYSQKDKSPHIAISVDMLDTGIDVPEIANLVLFKPIYSRIKFWQMIGRGTRLCPDLFGPGEDKVDFRIFDFCFNFDFFRENPQGIEASTTVSLGTKLFQTRVQLLSTIRRIPDIDQEETLSIALSDHLYNEVLSMNKENFIVRMHLNIVEKYQRKDSWSELTNDDIHKLQNELATLPTEMEKEDLESRLFDLTMLRMQLSVADGSMSGFEKLQKKVLDIASLLEEKINVPAVKAQIEYIAAIQEASFWEGITLNMLEDMRLRMRDLVTLIDRKSKKIVYTNFKDEIMCVRSDDIISIPRMTGVQYEKKVKDYLSNHLDDLVIHRLRCNIPLTQTDLNSLESVLVNIGEDEGKRLLHDLLERSGSPSLSIFVRSIVGLDRSTVQKAFSKYLSNRSLTVAQIRFVEMIIDQLSSRGIIEASALYQSPFTNVHSGGPDELFAGKNKIIDAIFEDLERLNEGFPGSA